MLAFAGKKGDKPEDHTPRFEDYATHYNIMVDNRTVTSIFMMQLIVAAM